MLRQASALFLVVTFCTSCDYFSHNSVTSTSNLQVLDTVIDYTSVDVYPIFSECEDYEEKDNRKDCFESVITEKLSEILAQNEFKVANEINDSTSIEILIDNMGKASLTSINSPASILEELPDLENIIRKGINQLPTMKEAAKHKRGIYIKSKYKLVIVVETI